jgi:Arc/MetJ-type ribon-helix-helix transcriptional regulator
MLTRRSHGATVIDTAGGLMPRFSFNLTDEQQDWLQRQTHQFRSQADVMRDLIDSAQRSQDALARIAQGEKSFP